MSDGCNHITQLIVDLENESCDYAKNEKNRLFGIIEMINQCALVAEKIFEYIFSDRSFQIDHNKNKVFNKYYNFLKELAISKKNVKKEIGYINRNKFMSRENKVKYSTDLYNELYNDSGTIKIQLIKQINKYSREKYIIYSSIVKKLNLEEYNNEECLIFE